jgi:hypothetical protein
VQKDGEIFLVRAWDAISDLACPKIEIDNGGELKALQKFGCAISQCNQCPQWDTFIPKEELECIDPI